MNELDRNNEASLKDDLNTCASRTILLFKNLLRTTYFYTHLPIKHIGIASETISLYENEQFVMDFQNSIL